MCLYLLIKTNSDHTQAVARAGKRPLEAVKAAYKPEGVVPHPSEADRRSSESREIKLGSRNGPPDCQRAHQSNDYHLIARG